MATVNRKPTPAASGGNGGRARATSPDTQTNPSILPFLPRVNTQNESHNELVNEGADHKYFVIIPQIVWALAHDTYDLALWYVVKMIAGDAGECYVTTRDLATLAMMSTGKVTECRRRLLKNGLLAGKMRRDPGYPQPVWHLVIPDLWKRNVQWRAELGDRLAARIECKKSLHQVNTQERSPGEQGTSPGEQGTSPGETKENHKEKPTDDPTRKNQAAAGFSLKEGNTVTCSIHDCPMEQRSKDGAIWFSHRLADGSWSKGGPTDVQEPHVAERSRYAAQFYLVQADA